MITHFLLVLNVSTYISTSHTFFRNDIRLILRGLTFPKKQTININNYMGISFQKELKRIAFKQGD